MTSGGVDIAQALLFGKCQHVEMWREGIAAQIYVYGNTVVWELSYPTAGQVANEIREELIEYEPFKVKDWEYDGISYGRYRHDDATYSGGVDIGRWSKVEWLYNPNAAATAPERKSA